MTLPTIGDSPPTSFRFGAVILAAGGSRRMGRPKQLLPIEGSPLLLRTVQTVLASPAWPVVVVLGHAADTLRPLLARLPVQVVHNAEWSKGLGSSILTGIQILERFSTSLDGALIALADQPHLSSSAIGRLSSVFRGPDSIAAARYSDATGVPVIFGRSYFPELLALQPEHGAQRLLRAHAACVAAVDLPELAVDLDTPEDYQRFLEAPPPSH